MDYRFSDSDPTTQPTTDSSLSQAVTSSLGRFADNATDIVQIEQYRRIQNIHDACADSNLLVDKPVKVSSRAFHYFSAKYNFSYYKIPKTGCSIWTQIFSVLNKGSNQSRDVFRQTRPYIHRELTRQNKLRSDKTNRPQFPSVIPSRDPYSRLYSGYIDKIFLSLFPNEVIQVINNQRNNVRNGSICARDATFPDFVKNILKNVFSGKRINKHWAPITSICDPCKADILAIAKQETFSADVEFILNKVGVANDELEIIQDALHKHKVEATLPGYISEVLTHGSKRKTCKTNVDVAKDIWSALKIPGYLREDVAFPVRLAKSEHSLVTPERLTRLVFKAIRNNPLTSEQRQRQRRTALVTAYENVDKNTIEGLKQVYKKDFALFDYSTEPPRN